MIRRAVFLGFLVVLPVSAGQGRDVFSTPLAEPSLLSYGIQKLTVVDHGTSLRVVLMGESVPQFRGAVPKPSPAGQVWLLRRDGTAVPHLSGLRANALVSMGGWATPSQDLSFQHVAADELAGVVIAVNGKLIVREFR
jgi:hypothetical protein